MVASVLTSESFCMNCMARYCTNHGVTAIEIKVCGRKEAKQFRRLLGHTIDWSTQGLSFDPYLSIISSQCDSGF